MPGPAAALRVLERRGAAYVWDPATDTIAWIAQVIAPDFVLAATDVQNGLLAKWGLALATACRAVPVVKQIQVVERTVPDTDNTIEAYTASMTLPHGPAADAYRELVAGAGRGSATHETFVTVSVSRRAAPPRLARAGVDHVLEWVEQQMSAFATTLQAAGILIKDRPTPERLGEVILGSLCPSAAATLPVGVGVRPDVWGPLSAVETPETYITDGHYHAAFVVTQFPQGQATHGDCLWPMIFPEMSASIYGRSLALIYRPYHVRETRRSIQQTHGQAQSAETMRRKLGRATTLADQREMADLQAREQELDQGHREVAVGAVGTITALSEAALEDAVVAFQAAAASANIDVRRVTYQTAAATLAALPLGRLA